jgi:gliding motility-associated-like protein
MKQLFILFLALVCGSAVFAQRPSTPASNLKFTNIGCNEVKIEWSNGNGAERAVFIKKGSAFTSVPVDNEYYTPDAANPFSPTSPAESIYDDKVHFCVFRGGGVANSVIVKGLKNVTTYYVAIFEYNANGSGTYAYLTSTYPTESFTTVNIKASFTLTPTSQCANGNIVRFTNSSSTTQTPSTMTYKWFYGDGFTSTNQNPSHTYASYGIYKVKLVTNALGCTDTTLMNDTINPHPIPSFDLDPSKLKNDSVQCFYGNRYTFRNKTILPPLGGTVSSTRYEWYLNDTALFSNAYKSDKAIPFSGVFKIKLVAFSDQNCKDSIFKYFNVLPRAIDPNKVIISPKSMCLNNNLFTFANNSPLCISSRWRFGEGGADSLDGNPVKHTYSKIGKYYITLKSYDNNNCLDVYKDSLEVVANTPVSFTGLLKEYCINTKGAILLPKPSRGLFFGDNVNSNDSTWLPKTLGKNYIGYVYTVGNCKDTAWDSTNVVPRPDVSLGNDTIICAGTPFQLSVDPKYSSYWLPTNVSGSVLAITATNTYTVISKEGNCADTASVNVRVINAPKISHNNDTTLCGGSFLKFNFKVDLGTAIWSDGSNLKDRNITKTGFYKVVLSNKCGTVSDSFNLKVEETACVVFFPNAFTPNFDLLNDAWQPFGKYEFIQMNIFNRWGERVYFSDQSPIWDGHNMNKDLCLDGVYAIVFEYLMQDGNSTKRITKGIPVHLIR